jgi:hypothetical protein
MIEGISIVIHLKTLIILSILLDASTKLGDVHQGANKATRFLSFFQAHRSSHWHAALE